MKTRESGMPSEEMWNEFFAPATILSKLGLDADCGNVVEFGCGYGTFTLPAAKIARGVVYGIDIDPEMVRAALAKADDAGITNICIAERDFATTGTGLADESVGYAMLFNILHAEERGAMLAEARRVLHPGGKLGVIHWNYNPATPRGPSMEIRPRPQQCQAWCEAAGFRIRPPGLIDLPPYHYGFAFERSE